MDGIEIAIGPCGGAFATPAADQPGLPEKRRYCVGYLFSPDFSRVVLIRKARPEWQAGLLNGVGGKLKDGEEPLRGMEREFMEETANKADWHPLARLDFPEATVWFFWAVSASFMDCTSVTDEKIEFHWTKSLQDRDDLVPNVRWLVPMAVSLSKGEHARHFMVQEAY